MRKQIKDIILYSFDIDGTSNKNTNDLHIMEEQTLSRNEPFPSSFIESLIRLKQKKDNVNFMITTGRSLDSVFPILDSLPWINNSPLFSYIGCVNGAFIYKWDQSTHKYKLIKKFNGMSKEDCVKLVQVVESLNLPIFLQTENLNRYYLKKNWNDEKYDSGMKLKNWSNKHITYKEFYENVHENILSMVIDTFLIARPPLSEADKYIYSEEQIHKHQRNRFNDKFEFSQVLRELQLKNGAPKSSYVLVSGTNTIDISVITKADALKTVIKDLNISRDQVSHSGDNFNDLPAWKFLRSTDENIIKQYGEHRGICNAMSNTWDHLKLVTGDKIIETNTVADFVDLSTNYDKIHKFLLWDKTNSLSSQGRRDLIAELSDVYKEDNLSFELIKDYYESNQIQDLNRENTMIIQINHVGKKTHRIELKKFVKQLQQEKRIAKMHVYYDKKIRL